MSQSMKPNAKLVRRLMETAAMPFDVLRASVMIVTQLAWFFAGAIVARLGGVWNRPLRSHHVAVFPPPR